jgi:hypothetical protein
MSIFFSKLKLEKSFKKAVAHGKDMLERNEAEAVGYNNMFPDPPLRPPSAAPGRSLL